jgi:hypothetical protein
MTSRSSWPRQASCQELRGRRVSVAAYVSIRQHTAAYVNYRQGVQSCGGRRVSVAAYGSIRQHTAAYGSIRQLQARCPELRGEKGLSGRIRQHTSAYVNYRQGVWQRLCCVRICTGVQVKQVNCVTRGPGVGVSTTEVKQVN